MIILIKLFLDVQDQLFMLVYKHIDWPSSINGWQLAKMKKSIPDMSLP